MEEFISNIIETGLGYIPEFTMKDIVILVVSLVICLLFAMFGYKLLKGEAGLLVGVVGLVIDLLDLGAVGLQRGVPPADAHLQPLLDTVFLGPVQVLGTFLA